MFDDLQRLFKDSVAAFRAEVGKREPVDEVAELLSSMRRELTATRALLPELAAEVERARLELLRERSELEQCERRGKMAGRIGDHETVRVAAEFSRRHRERIGMLERKVAAAEEEHALRSREAEDMQRKYRAAEADRFRMVAALMRQRAQERQRAAATETQNSLADFARMEEKISGDAGRTDALGELEDRPPPTAPGADVDQRLQELKRRMGRD